MTENKGEPPSSALSVDTLLLCRVPAPKTHSTTHCNLPPHVIIKQGPALGKPGGATRPGSDQKLDGKLLTNKLCPDCRIPHYLRSLADAADGGPDANPVFAAAAAAFTSREVPINEEGLARAKSGSAASARSASSVLATLVLLLFS